MRRVLIREQAELILVPLFGRSLLLPLGDHPEDFVIDLVDLQQESRRDVLLRGISAGLGLHLKLALLGIVHTGDVDGLAGRRKELLQDRLFTLRVVKNPAVHGKSHLPILLVHEGQQLFKLGKKLLLVDFCHLR